MVDHQDNTKQSDSTLESSQENNAQSSPESTGEKKRLKFDKKDMLKIKFNF